ncbi:hypothetical protein YS40_066 [Thermus phage phiYS40]|uniref:hypothetical protein n=1 Tax=Thermus phage phiYS40 TaxID=407392 RepID=UPI0000E689B8|nr:hypothetical protein YS40_066 [Thermus phage phiYS40]ABJ91460.1 hypothetical protein YS40_066 [Thermus phage phiYS40]BAK53584.1 hypothetical protein YSP_066 [Thermus phage phiYS40]
MEKLIHIYYIKSAISEDKKIKFLRLKDLCVQLDDISIKSCNKDVLNKMFIKEHIVNSPYSDEMTLIKFAEKLTALRKIYGDNKILEII